MNTNALTEAATLARLDEIKQTLVELERSFIRADYEQVLVRYALALRSLAVCHAKNKQGRDRLRVHYRNSLQGDELTEAIDALSRQSQQDGMARRRLKRERDEAIAPFAAVIEKNAQQVRRLKQQYKTLSIEWQAQMQATYFAEHAAMGLCVPILYQDDALIVVNKPAGLLAVPGRRCHLQDSVLSRLRLQMPERSFLQAVHRLDKDTSGVMAIATSPGSQAALSQQFAQRQVRKTYEAILSKPVQKHMGTIDLPLWGSSEDRPRQTVDFLQGKPSRTDFRVLTFDDRPRVELIPHTGRTHQLRVHAASCKGLYAPILGDVLYGVGDQQKRLYLHAKRLEFRHPLTDEALHFRSVLPF